VMDIT